MSLAGRVALVTGSGRGIGAETARTLAREGCHVVVNARTGREIADVAATIVADGGRAVALAADVTLPDEVERLMSEIDRAYGPVDILVNNAGTASSNRMGRTTLEEWNRLMTVNATSVFLCTRAVFDGMVERGWGRVVSVASMAGLEGKRYVTAYTAAKHAVVGFTRAAAAEAAGTGVEVSVVCPGYVATPLTDQTVARVVERTGRPPEEALRSILDAAGQARLVEVDEVAAAIVDLCSDGHEARNGSLILLEGKDVP